MTDKSRSLKTAAGVFLILGSVLSLIFAIISFAQNNGFYVISHTYGGDAYTGIQHAAADTGNNVKALAEAVSFCFGALFLILTVVLFAFALKCFGDAKTSHIPPVSTQTPSVYPQTPVSAPSVYPQTPTGPVGEAVMPIRIGGEKAVCPRCGTTQKEGLGVCTQCGARFLPPPKPAPVPQPAEAHDSAPSNKKDGVVFPMVFDSSTVGCPLCGTRQSIHNKNCAACGARFE